jgi:hypothetical protein
MAEISRRDEFLHARCTNPQPCPEQIPVPRNEVPQPQPDYVFHVAATGDVQTSEPSGVSSSRTSAPETERQSLALLRLRHSRGAASF